MAIAQKIIFAILLLSLILTTNYLLPTTVHAAEEKDFSTSYDVIYDVGADGITAVTEKIILRNLTSQYYATQFSLNIGSTQISDISASDPGGSMEVKQDLKGTSTKLTVKFNQQIAGKDKTLAWTLKFKSKDFAQHLGKIWEVTLPKIVPDLNLEGYNLVLNVPSNFGEPGSITPNPKKTESTSGKTILTFTKDALLQSGVLAIFGETQVFDFNLNYHLKNPGLIPTLTSIALPPDTEYQDVSFSAIYPKPLNITLDSDGNYLAWYRLKRAQTLDAVVTGAAKLYLNSRVKNPNLDPALRQKYLASSKFWESNHPAIKSKLVEILGTNPPTINFEKARLIHRFVANTLKYNPSRLSDSMTKRLGAVTALNNPTEAVCMEYTDLFIALARAGGIPAREINGFAFSSNSNLRPLSLQKDVLHSWPEIFDEEKGWVMIDPTWEGTTGGVDYFSKIDLNHFAFVRKGISSEQPLPAGSYKVSDSSKDVDVHFSDKEFNAKPTLNIAVETPQPAVAGFPNKIKVRVENQGNLLAQSSFISLIAANLIVLDSVLRTGPIPAFGSSTFEFNIRSKSLLDEFDDVVEVTVGNQKIQKPLNVKPFIVFRNFPFVLFGLIGIVALIYFGILGGFIYKRRILKRKKL